MPFIGGKTLIGSKTFWGVLLGSIPVLSDAALNVAQAPELPLALKVGLGITGGLLALVGRISAQKQITSIV